MRKYIVTVLAALTASLAAPAAAETVSVVVTYDDLNLASPAGVATLEERIKAAAAKACGVAERHDISGMVAWEECRAAAIADAMEQMAAVVPSKSVALAASPGN